ncbi:hypothetical protein Lal_00024500 [Lupinus albus]|nr:hypothetical protein Lal_00024500 [Lupinus albus]
MQNANETSVVYQGKIVEPTYWDHIHHPHRLSSLQQSRIKTTKMSIHVVEGPLHQASLDDQKKLKERGVTSNYGPRFSSSQSPQQTHQAATLPQLNIDIQ